MADIPEGDLLRLFGLILTFLPVTSDYGGGRDFGPKDAEVLFVLSVHQPISARERSAPPEWKSIELIREGPSRGVKSESCKALMPKCLRRTGRRPPCQQPRPWCQGSCISLVVESATTMLPHIEERLDVAPIDASIVVDVSGSCLPVGKKQLDV